MTESVNLSDCHRAALEREFHRARAPSNE